MFRNAYNYATEIFSIPSVDPEDALTAKILSFRKGKQKGDLMVLYYAGHGSGGPEECIWSATDSLDSPSLNWHNIQGLLLGHPPDVLLVLDCCFSSLASGEHSIGDNWFLGSSVKESMAVGVSWKSFTRSMIRQLDIAANRYWTDKKVYNVQSLSHT